MRKEIIIGPHVDYDGILTEAERRKILNRIESAFGWLGASIPEEIELAETKFKLRIEIQKLIMKSDLTREECEHIKKIISLLEDHGNFLKAMVKTDKLSEHEAMELSDTILGILRAVHELRELIKKAPQGKALDAKEELMHNIEDTKRWLKYTKRLR
ncbi:DUF5788 family protein [[Eubacterium] cellulosolvens]